VLYFKVGYRQAVLLPCIDLSYYAFCFGLNVTVSLQQSEYDVISQEEGKQSTSADRKTGEDRILSPVRVQSAALWAVQCPILRVCPNTLALSC
jgi:hypothetical protein